MNLESPWAPTSHLAVSSPPARLRHVLLELAAVVHDAQLRARRNAVAHGVLHVGDPADVVLRVDVVVRLKYSKPAPTFLGFGIISSSESDDIPAPNCNMVLKSSLVRVVYLLGVRFNFNIYGTVDLNSDNCGSLYGIFAIS